MDAFQVRNLSGCPKCAFSKSFPGEGFVCEGDPVRFAGKRQAVGAGGLGQTDRGDGNGLHQRLFDQMSQGFCRTTGCIQFMDVVCFGDGRLVAAGLFQLLAEPMGNLVQEVDPNGEIGGVDQGGVCLAEGLKDFVSDLVPAGGADDHALEMPGQITVVVPKSGGCGEVDADRLCGQFLGD